MSNYQRVTYIDRCRISSLMEAGKSVCEIAQLLKFHKSTIYREINRNKRLIKGYEPGHAQMLSRRRLRFCRKRKVIVGEVRRLIVSKLNEGWSPDEISERYKRVGLKIASHETIYRFIQHDFKNGGQLFKLLRRQRTIRKRRFPRLSRHSESEYYRNIKDRPKTANTRAQRGHWERDTMMGRARKSSILVMVDRKTRYCQLEKLKKNNSAEVQSKTEKIILRTGFFGSITSDNGPEMRGSTWRYQYRRKLFYCDPYRSNQRGSVENLIGLVRQYLPKGIDLNKISNKQIKHIERKLNNRPRKILDYRTPSEVFFDKPSRW